MDTVDALLDRAHTAEPTGDPDAAVEFLRMLDPDGWHNLVAFHPDGGPDDARTFAPGQWEAMHRWIAARISKRDLYFSVNEPKPSAPHDRLGKEHIAHIRAVYADIDPRDEALREAGGFDAERMRIAAQVEELERHFNDAPTFVIDSGGGMQPFWQLDRKLDAGERGRWAEGVGRAIYKQLDGDAVQNIDRVMRLPGTINHAGGKKRALGRKPAPAILRYADGGRHHPEWLEQWAPLIAAPDKDDAAWKDIPVDMGAVREAATYEDLPVELRAKFEALCDAEPSVRALWEGDRSARPGDNATGSGFAAALARCLRHTGQFTATEFGQLLHVWEHASNPEHIDKRQIQRAWGRLGKPAAEEEFEPVEVAEPVRKRKARDGIRTVDWLTLITEEVEEEPDYIEPNFAGAGNFVLLAGPPKAQKSFLLQEMLVACATGGEFLAGAFTVPRPLRVFNLQAEMNRKLLRKRARLIGLDDLSEEQRRMLRSNLKVSERFHMLLDANGVRTAIATIKACYPGDPPDVIAVDPLANVYDQESENDTTQMMQFLTGRLEKIRQAINPRACIVLVHHSTKCSPEDLARDPFNAIRGAGALRGYYDSAVVIFRKGEESKLRRVHFELRSGESPPPVEVEFVGGRFHTREPGAEIDRETARNILKAIEEAWKSGNPWSHHPQAKSSGRHAARIVTSRFGMDARSAAYLVDQWLMDGVIAHRPRTRSRPAGLEVTGSIEDSLFQNVTLEHPPNSENRKNSEKSAARKGVQKRAAARRGRR